MDTPQTEFNSNLESLKRLNRELALCNAYSKLAKTQFSIEDLKMWKASIESAYNEVDPKLKKIKNKHEREAYKEEWGKPSEKLYVKTKNKHGVSVVINRRGFKQRIKTYTNVERWIRRKATKYGMLITDQRDDQGL